MAFRTTPKLTFPLMHQQNIAAHFLTRSVHDGKYWGMHLGIDVNAPAETEVLAVGRGVVVYSKIHPGEFSADGKIVKRNWGGIVIVAHKHPSNKKIFYSLYGHLGKRFVKKGDAVEIGQVIGTVGKALSESNGIWEDEHLHFAIYVGKLKPHNVLPGYYREDEANTNLEAWADPINFIKRYNFKYI